MYPRGNTVDNLSVYLDVQGASELPLGWSRCVQFSFTVVNQVQRSKSITWGTLFAICALYFTSKLVLSICALYSQSNVCSLFRQQALLHTYSVDKDLAHIQLRILVR